MKKTRKQLSLSRETLRTLSSRDEAKIRGGQVTGLPNTCLSCNSCPTDKTW